MPFVQLETPPKAYFGGIPSPTKSDYMIDLEAQRSETLSDPNEKPGTDEKTLPVDDVPHLTTKAKWILALGYLTCAAILVFICILWPFGYLTPPSKGYMSY